MVGGWSMLEDVLVLKRINTVLRCIFVIGSFISLVLLLLALRNNTLRMVSASCMHVDK